MAVISPVDTSNFRKMIAAISQPRWLQAYNGSRFQYVKGVVADALMDTCGWSTLARYPQTEVPGALIPIGRDRGITRGPSESDTSYAYRLQQYRTDWRYAGGPQTILRQLQALFLPSRPTMRIVWVNDPTLPAPTVSWYEIDGNGDVTWTRDIIGTGDPIWNWGDTEATNRWWRFWIVIDSADTGWVPWDWGSGVVYGDGHTWGSTATVDEVASVVSVIKKWTRGGAYCDHVILSFDPAKFIPSNPTATTGLYYNALTRDPDAAYWPVGV